MRGRYASGGNIAARYRAQSRICGLHPTPFVGCSNDVSSFDIFSSNKIIYSMTYYMFFLSAGVAADGEAAGAAQYDTYRIFCLSVQAWLLTGTLRGQSI